MLQVVRVTGSNTRNRWIIRTTRRFKTVRTIRITRINRLFRMHSHKNKTPPTGMVLRVAFMSFAVGYGLELVANGKGESVKQPIIVVDVGRIV